MIDRHEHPIHILHEMCNWLMASNAKDGVLITMNYFGLTVPTATIWSKEHGHAHIGMEISFY